MVSKTVVQAIRDIRAAVRDESGSTWDASADLLPRLNDTMHRLWAEKPEAFYVSKVLTAEPAELTSATSGSLPVLDQYALAVVAHVAYLLLHDGRRDGDREASIDHLNTWNRIVHPRR